MFCIVIRLVSYCLYFRKPMVINISFPPQIFTKLLVPLCLCIVKYLCNISSVLFKVCHNSYERFLIILTWNTERPFESCHETSALYSSFRLLYIHFPGLSLIILNVVLFFSIYFVFLSFINCIMRKNVVCKEMFTCIRN